MSRLCDRIQAGVRYMFSQPEHSQLAQVFAGLLQFCPWAPNVAVQIVEKKYT